MNDTSKKSLTVSLRPMNVSDVSQVYAVETSAHSVPWSEKTFYNCLAAYFDGVVAEYEGRIIGYGFITISAGEAHILNLAVRPEFQGLAVGKQLVRYFLDLSRIREVEKIFLEVRVSNLAAIQLYRFFDFTIVGERKAYYKIPGQEDKEDAYVMALTLRIDRSL